MPLCNVHDAQITIKSCKAFSTSKTNVHKLPLNDRENNPCLFWLFYSVATFMLVLPILTMTVDARGVGNVA